MNAYKSSVAVVFAVFFLQALLLGQENRKLESASQRVKKFKKSESEILIPEGFDLESIELSFQFSNPEKLPIPGIVWTGDALIDFNANAKVVGNWEDEPPKKSSQRILKAKLLVDLQSYCSLSKYMGRARTKKLDLKTITPSNARKILEEIGDMKTRAFDTMVIELKIPIPVKIAKDEVQMKPMALTLPWSIDDKKELTIYRMVARTDSKEKIATKEPGFVFTFGRTNREKNAGTMKGLVRLLSIAGLVDRQTQKELNKMIDAWFKQ